MSEFSYEGLYALLEGRNKERPEGSYTTYLFEKGLDKINQSLKDHKLTSLIHYNDMIQSSGHLFLMRIPYITPEQISYHS